MKGKRKLRWEYLTATIPTPSSQSDIRSENLGQCDAHRWPTSFTMTSGDGTGRRHNAAPPSMSVYFTSDNHFGHAGARSFYRRPFASVAEMDRQMIDRWNSVVEPGDR